MNISDLIFEAKEKSEEALKEWKKLVSSSDDVTIFSSSFCYNIFAQKSICCFVYLKNELVGGTIGYFRGDWSILKFIAKTLWIDSGILVNRNYSEHEIMIKTYLLNKLKEVAKNNSCIQVKIGQWNRERNCEVFTLAKYISENIRTYEINLNLKEDELFSRIKSKYRSIIRKGIKNKVRVEHCNREVSLRYFDEFYNLYLKTQKRAIKRYKNVDLIIKSKDFLFKLLDKSQALLSLAFYNNVLASAAFLILSSDKITWYAGASNIEINRLTGASNLLHWEIIKWFKENKFSNYDIGGPVNPEKSSPAYGVYRFKKSFNGEIANYFCGSYVISKFKYSMFNYFAKKGYITRLVTKIFE